MKITLGKNTELIVIDKEFYCRYDKIFSHKCHKRHRMGFWFKIKLTYQDTSIYIIDGDGEFEGSPSPFNFDIGEYRWSGMSGATRYTFGYETCGGWKRLKLPITTEEKEEKREEISLSKDEEIFISKRININIVKYLTMLIEKIDCIPDLNLEYSHLYPLLYTFHSGNTISLPLGAFLVRERNSWKQRFIWDKISFSLKKQQFKLLRVSFVEVVLGKEERDGIIYAENNGRKIAYFLRKGILYGLEQYRDILHPLCSLRDNDVDTRSLFIHRLGDVLFLTETYKLVKPPVIHIEKMEVLRGKLDKEEMVLEGEGEIVVFHPEHGILQLPGGHYKLYSVPYITRGHDD